MTKIQFLQLRGSLARTLAECLFGYISSLPKAKKAQAINQAYAFMANTPAISSTLKRIWSEVEDLDETEIEHARRARKI